MEVIHCRSFDTIYEALERAGWKKLRSAMHFFNMRNDVDRNEIALEKEMKSVEFDLALQTDGETFAVMKLPELIAMFEEFFLRASVLKTNPHIRSFWDRSMNSLSEKC